MPSSAEAVEKRMTSRLGRHTIGAPELAGAWRTRLFNSNKLVDAKIIGHEITTAADGTTELRLTVEAAAVVSGGAYSVGTQEVRIGKDFKVKTLDVEIEGCVLTMEKVG